MNPEGSDPAPFFIRLVPGSDVDLTRLDCGEPSYDAWLERHALAAVKAGTSAVHLLAQDAAPRPVAVGYVAISPTAVARRDLPGAVSRGMASLVPGYLIAKMALDRRLRGDGGMRWGTQLLVEGLRQIVLAADRGGGRVIVVGADNGGLLGFYRRHSFLPTGVDPLRLYMKVATARAALGELDVEA